MPARTGLIFQTELAVKWSFQTLIVFFYWPESHPSNSTASHSGVIHIWVCLSLENLINFSRFDWALFLISAAGLPEFIFLELRTVKCARATVERWKVHRWNCFGLIRFSKGHCHKKLIIVLMACLLGNAGVSSVFEYGFNFKSHSLFKVTRRKLHRRNWWMKRDCPPEVNGVWVCLIWPHSVA